MSADPPRVLVVDDHELNRKVLETMVARLGCSVASATDGLQAVEQCATQRFDLVLMDWHIPNMDGLAATQEIRRRESGTRVPIVAVTADARADARDVCLAAGMDDFMSKPVMMPAVRAMVERWVRFPA